MIATNVTMKAVQSIADIIRDEFIMIDAKRNEQDIVMHQIMVIQIM